MSARDFYKILGVERTVSESDLKRAYRELAKKFHPDRNPDDKAAEDRFKDISEAYRVLSDKEQRALYDEFGEIGLREGFDADAYRAYASAGSRGGMGGPDLGDLFGGGVVDFDFADFFGPRGTRGGAWTPRRQRGHDLQSEVTIDFRDAVLGCEKELLLSASPSEPPRTLKVRVPAGVRQGGKIRLPGQGGPGIGGGPKGDLVLKVNVRNHEHFWQERGSLHVKLPVTPLEAYRGAKVTVPTPHGEVQLAVPAGSQSGQKLRLRGKGIAKKGRAVGDLIAHLQIVLPARGVAEVDSALETVVEAFAKDPREGIKL